MKDLNSQQEKERDNVEKKLKDAEIVQRGQLEDQTVEDIVKSLKRQYSNEELPPALEKILDD